MRLVAVAPAIPQISSPIGYFVNEVCRSHDDQMQREIEGLTA